MSTVGQSGSDVDRWSEWLETEARRVVDVAAGSGLGGDAAWDAVLGQWSVDPLPAAERLRHTQKGPPRRSGPAPIEVRWVLSAVCRYAGQALSALERERPGMFEDQAVEQRVDRIRRRLDDLPGIELKAYVARVRPPVTTSSIFANAVATSRNYTAASSGPGLATLSCPCCGAPRREESRSRTCEFCGSDL